MKILKNKSVDRILIGILSVAIVALILIVMMLLSQQRKLISSLSNSSRQTQTPVPTPAVSLPLVTISYRPRSDWQSFTSDSLGFDVQYPQGYKVGELTKGKRVEFLNCLTKGIKSEQLCRPAFEISVYADYDGGSRRVWLSKKYVLENPKYEDIMVDGSKGLWVINNNLYQLVAIPRGKLMYVFGTNYVVSKTDGKTWPDKDFVRSILSTFKFIAPTITEQGKDFSKNEPEKTNLDIGVLVIKYFPRTVDGQKIDLKITGDVGEKYDSIRQKTIDITDRLKSAIERSSSYLGYKNSSAPPSLKYRIVDLKEYTQPVPFKPLNRQPEYRRIMEEHNICNYVNDLGVREVWLFAYQGPTYPGSSYPYLNIWESEMAGPYGDISNSGHDANMPVCQSSYRVYTFNYGRGTAEALESWGHQMEAELSAVDKEGIFRRKFQGPNYPQTLSQTGRCGSVHNPPNAKSEYNRNNSTPQKSDCLNWNPDGLGILSDISCLNWGCEDKGDNDNSALNYMIWNWQNLPGRDNDKTYQGKRLRNWWQVHLNFDLMMKNRWSLLSD